MKFISSIAVVAAVMTAQVMAVVPVPIKECTKTVLVLPTDTGCTAFAQANGVTFDDLLRWNQKLRTDCLNLDVGFGICVSVTPGNCCIVPNVGHPQPNATSSTAPPPASSSTTLPATSASSSGTAAPSSSAGGSSSGIAASSTSASVSASNSPKPTVANTQNSAQSTKGSMLVAVAGVLLSAAYIL